MRSNKGPLGPHETKLILEGQFRGERPIGPAFVHASGGGQPAGGRVSMRLDPSFESELIGGRPDPTAASQLIGGRRSQLVLEIRPLVR